MVLFLVAAAALYRSQPPVISDVSFDCTPSWFNLRKVSVGCAEGVEVRLWGLRRASPYPPSGNSRAVIEAAFRAKSGQMESDGTTIPLEGAPLAKCFSTGTGSERVSQCFVQSAQIFGPEDVACDLIHGRVVSVRASSKRHYLICLKGGRPA